MTVVCTGLELSLMHGTDIDRQTPGNSERTVGAFAGVLLLSCAFPCSAFDHAVLLRAVNWIDLPPQ